MKKIVWRLSIFAAIFCSLYAARHFFMGTALEFALHRSTGEPIAYTSRSWEEGKLVYRDFSVGEQLYVEDAAVEFDFHLFPFSVTSHVHLTAPTIHLDDADNQPINLSFLLPAKYLTVKLDIERGNLASPEGKLYTFDFVSGKAREEIGALSVYQEETAPLFTCKFNFLAGSLSSDFQMEEAPFSKTVPLASLFYPLHTWNVLEGTASASIKATYDVGSWTFLQGKCSLQNIRFESDDLIFAVDAASSEIDFQGDIESFALDTDFKGADLFWKELEVLRAQGSIVLKPHELKAFEAHAAVHLADLEGRADLVGQGEIHNNETLWIEGTLDYVTAQNPLKVDFSWADDGKSQVFQTNIYNLGKEILSLLNTKFPSWKIKQGTVEGKITTFLDNFIFERMQINNIKVHQLAMDELSFQEIEAEGILNLLSGDIEQLTLQAHDVQGQYQSWKISSANAALSIKENHFEPSSAFGKIENIPFSLQFRGPLDSFHASAKLAAGVSEWLQFPKNPEESPIVLDLSIDRKQEEFQISGILSSMDDCIQLQAHGDFLTKIWKGGFQGPCLRSTFYAPFLKILAPTINVGGELAVRGQFSSSSIDLFAKAQDLSIQSPDFHISVPGQSQEISYHFDFRQKQGTGKGKISPLILTSQKFPLATSITDGELVFDSLSEELTLQNLKGTLNNLSLASEQIVYSNHIWTFDTALAGSLSCRGQAVETSQGYRVTLEEGRAGESYLKGPLSFHFAFPGKIEELSGVIFLDTGSLAKQLNLLTESGLIEFNPKVKETLEQLSGSMTLRLIQEGDLSEYELQGSDIHYASSLFNSVEAYIIKQGNEWTLKRCMLDDIRMRGQAAYQNNKWVIPSWEIDWKELHLHAAGIYENEKFDFKVDGELASRFILKGTGIFLPAAFQNLSFHMHDRSEQIASLTCEKLKFQNGKWESPAVDLTVFSKHLTQPIYSKLILNVGTQSTSFQGSSESKVKVGKSVLKIEQICGLVEAGFLNLKCAASLDNEPLHFLGKFDSRFAGGVNIKKGEEVLKLSLSDPTTCQKAEGQLLGIAVSLQKELEGSLGGDRGGYRGTVSLKDSSKLADLLDNENLRQLSGLQLIGTFNKGAFKGELNGKDAVIQEYQIEELHAQVDYTPTHFQLRNISIQDPAGSFAIKECLGVLTDTWNLSIPLLKGKEIKPSALRKLGTPQKEIKPLQIRHLVMTDLKGQLGDLKSFRGIGSLNFTQLVKKEPSVFDIPLTLLKDFGLDLDLFTPVIGEVSLQLKDGKLFFIGLQNAFSEGKRSEFYLAEGPSYIDLNGPLYLNLRMQQNVVLKLAEPFMIAVRGTWEKPKYSLQ